MSPSPQSDADTRRRQRWLSLLAKAPAARLETLWQSLGAAPAYTVLRRPEIGLVMVKGRISGSGAAFCAGEMTATRTAIRLESGEIGIGYAAAARRARPRSRRRSTHSANAANGATSWKPGSWRRSPPKPRRGGAWRQPAPPRPKSTSSPWHGRPGHEPAGERARSGPGRSRPRRATPVPRGARCLRASRPHRRAWRMLPPAPGALSPATAAYLLTLVDRDTPLWLAPEFDLPAVRDFVRFHTGAPIVAGRGEAAVRRAGARHRYIARRLRHRHRPLSRPLRHPGDRGAGAGRRYGTTLARSRHRRGETPSPWAGSARISGRRWACQPRAVSLRRRHRVHRRTQLLALPRSIVVEG